MTNPDAERWNARYRDAERPVDIDPPEVVAWALDDIGPDDRALDVACGWGDAGLWLASKGVSATLIDVSHVALDAAQERATTAGVSITTVAADLSAAVVPKGPWDAISCVHYLDRALLPRLGAELAVGGRLVVAIATTTNLERHERPSARFLLEPDELPTLVPELTVIHHSEAWRANGGHEAWGVFGSGRG